MSENYRCWVLKRWGLPKEQHQDSSQIHRSWLFSWSSYWWRMKGCRFHSPSQQPHQHLLGWHYLSISQRARCSFVWLATRHFLSERHADRAPPPTLLSFSSSWQFLPPSTLDRVSRLDSAAPYYHSYRWCQPFLHTFWCWSWSFCWHWKYHCLSRTFCMHSDIDCLGALRMLDRFAGGWFVATIKERGVCDRGGVGKQAARHGG